jgi:osmoprotectant transport system ATP-binding protein
VLAQYAPPAELLMYPANPFVADFVGSDRALKRLSLQRVDGIELLPADDAPDEPTIPADALLRDALSELLANEAQAGRVVDAHGDVVGALSIDQLSHAIAATPEAS